MMFYRFKQKILTVILSGLLINLSVYPAFSQVLPEQTDSIGQTDSLTVGELKADTTKVASTNELKSKVIYSADDSIMFDVPGQQVFLYGNASIQYEDINLKADYIEVNWLTHTLYATGRPDSSGAMAGLPVFKESTDEFKAAEIRYNFNTKKGKILAVETKEGDGIVRGGIVKKTDNDEYFIKGGAYTTCDAPHPHFYIASEKIKVIPGNKIVTGPANMIIEDVPTPFFIPFGFFPTKKGRKSGILFPAYGESAERGFFLQRAGYYFGISDYVDASLDCDFYSLGGWAVRANSQYANRYHYGGDFSVGYSITKISEPELPDYQRDRDFYIRWNHRQDAKARPNSTFTASVNMNSRGYYNNNITYDNSFITNTYSSSINYSKTFPGKPYNFSISANHTQNNNTGAVSISLPEAFFGVVTVYPFKRKVDNGNPRWYEKIGFNYTGRFLNQVNTYDSVLFENSTLNEFKNGFSHTIPVSTSFKVLKYFMLTPSFTYNDNWFTRTYEPYWSQTDSTVLYDTISGFKSARYFIAQAALNTRLYGMLQFKKGKIAAIRHVVNPSVGYAIQPDFSSPDWGYYREVQADIEGNKKKYTIFQNGIYGGPPAGKLNAITFGIDNNLEMKYRQVTDTAVNLKKIKLLESLNISSAYNFAADSINLSNINLTARTVLFERIDINIGTSFDPYIADSIGYNQNKFEWTENNRLARMENANMSVGFNLGKTSDKTSDKATEEELAAINAHPDNYIDFNVPYNLRVSYNISYSKPGLIKAIITQTVGVQGDVSITPKWKVAFQSGWDFQTHKRAYTSFGIFRDLHCWEMHLNWIPDGIQQSFSFQINVKSSVLQDLKLTKKNDRYDTF